jgi:aminoglycoside/choline kinase family phosphotransferase
VLVYRQLLAAQRFGAPAVYASAYDEVGERYWLLLEDLGDSTLKSGDLDDWLAAVRWLAAMHGTFLGRDGELRALGCLAEHGPDYYWSIAQTARGNLEQACAWRALARFDRLMARFESIIPLLSSQPRTLVHGDIFPRNLIVQPGHRIRPIDWESAGIGLPIWDLARLVSGWQRDKPAFLATYLVELDRCAAVPIDRRALEVTFTHCEILDVLWYFGWSVGLCTDEGEVAGLLDVIEGRWRRVDGGPIDG